MATLPDDDLYSVCSSSTTFSSCVGGPTVAAGMDPPVYLDRMLVPQTEVVHNPQAVNPATMTGLAPEVGEVIASVLMEGIQNGFLDGIPFNPTMTTTTTTNTVVPETADVDEAPSKPEEGTTTANTPGLEATAIEAEEADADKLIRYVEELDNYVTTTLGRCEKKIDGFMSSQKEVWIAISEAFKMNDSRILTVETCLMEMGQLFEEIRHVASNASKENAAAIAEIKKEMEASLPNNTQAGAAAAAAAAGPPTAERLPAHRTDPRQELMHEIRAENVLLKAQLNQAYKERDEARNANPLSVIPTNNLEFIRDYNKLAEGFRQLLNAVKVIMRTVPGIEDHVQTIQQSSHMLLNMSRHFRNTNTEQVELQGAAAVVAGHPPLVDTPAPPLRTGEDALSSLSRLLETWSQVDFQPISLTGQPPQPGPPQPAPGALDLEGSRVAASQMITRSSAGMSASGTGSKRKKNSGKQSAAGESSPSKRGLGDEGGGRIDVKLKYTKSITISGSINPWDSISCAGGGGGSKRSYKKEKSVCDMISELANETCYTGCLTEDEDNGPEKAESAKISDITEGNEGADISTSPPPK